MEELPVKLKTWKAEMETKILCVNMGKTKIMVSGLNLNLLKKSEKNPWRLSDRCRKKCRLLDAYPGSTRNAVESKAPCDVIS